MPELPEVETTRRGIIDHVQGQTVQQVIVRQPKLRWPIPKQLQQKLNNQTIRSVQRRAKYLILSTDNGHLIMHLGMSGTLRVLTSQQAPQKHDHVDIVFSDQCCLRFNDPRRFGAVLWTDEDPLQHPLLIQLGPEPLLPEFTAAHLQYKAKGKKQAIKTFIMDNHVVVGVGNIYASEALFKAAIHPQRSAGDISLEEFSRLVITIKETLAKAIEQGGTTLKDFVGADNKPGYFAQHLNVYGRAGESCYHCGHTIESKVINQRNSFFCPHCQH